MSKDNIDTLTLEFVKDKIMINGDLENYDAPISYINKQVSPAQKLLAKFSEILEMDSSEIYEVAKMQETKEDESKEIESVDEFYVHPKFTSSIIIDTGEDYGSYLERQPIYNDAGTDIRLFNSESEIYEYLNDKYEDIDRDDSIVNVTTELYITCPACKKVYSAPKDLFTKDSLTIFDASKIRNIVRVLSINKCKRHIIGGVNFK